jgi:Flp pilus assembly protein TadD
LLSLPKKTENLFKVIDEAGSFLMSANEFDDAFELYRQAVRKFPKVAAFHQRVSQCYAQEGAFDEALACNRSAIELDPEKAALMSDMGWTLVLAGRFKEAEATFLRALEMDPYNERVEANLQYTREQLSENSSSEPEPAAPPKPSAKKSGRAAPARKKASPKRRP